MVGRDETEDNVDEGERDPEDNPGWGDFELDLLTFRMAGWIFWLLVFLMAPIRSRN